MWQVECLGRAEGIVEATELEDFVPVAPVPTFEIHNRRFEVNHDSFYVTS
jgi:hypothetical protein